MLNTDTQAGIVAGEAAAAAFAPVLGPTGVAAVAAATAIMNAVMAAANQGRDITPEELAAVWAADDVQRAASAVIRAEIESSETPAP